MDDTYLLTDFPAKSFDFQAERGACLHVFTHCELKHLEAKVQVQLCRVRGAY